MELKYEQVLKEGWSEEFMIEYWHDTGKLDNKGRKIGFSCGFNRNGEQFCAWVQSARMNPNTREFQDFGVIQHAKYFTTAEEARNWSHVTVQERIAKYK